MGIGAGFKLRDKDEEKDPSNFEHKRSSKHSHKSSNNDASMRSNKKAADDSPLEPHNASGWTWMLEDWFCHGGTLVAGKAINPSSSEISVPKPLYARSISSASGKEPPQVKGPYQLLAKERLMGIYLAIYVHRDLKQLIKGMWLSVQRRANSISYF
jgi:hypothetical protein